MKIDPYPETHMEGMVTIETTSVESLFDYQRTIPKCDLGIRIGEDGRIWICIDGVSFLRFKPIDKYLTVDSELKAPNGG